MYIGISISIPGKFLFTLVHTCTYKCEQKVVIFQEALFYLSKCLV